MTFAPAKKNKAAIIFNKINIFLAALLKNDFGIVGLQLQKSGKKIIEIRYCLMIKIRFPVLFLKYFFPLLLTGDILFDLFYQVYHQCAVV